MVTLEEMESYVRGEGVLTERDQTLLLTLIEAAEEWFTGAGVSPKEDNPLYDLGVKMLTGYWFDQRNGGEPGNLTDVPPGVVGIRHQLEALS